MENVRKDLRQAVAGDIQTKNVVQFVHFELLILNLRINYFSLRNKIDLKAVQKKTS